MQAMREDVQSNGDREAAAAYVAELGRDLERNEFRLNRFDLLRPPLIPAQAEIQGQTTALNCCPVGVPTFMGTSGEGRFDLMHPALAAIARSHGSTRFATSLRWRGSMRKTRPATPMDAVDHGLRLMPIRPADVAAALAFQAAPLR